MCEASRRATIHPRTFGAHRISITEPSSCSRPTCRRFGKLSIGTTWRAAWRRRSIEPTARRQVPVFARRGIRQWRRGREGRAPVETKEERTKEKKRSIHYKVASGCTQSQAAAFPLAPPPIPRAASRARARARGVGPRGCAALGPRRECIGPLCRHVPRCWMTASSSTVPAASTSWSCGVPGTTPTTLEASARPALAASVLVPVGVSRDGRRVVRVCVCVHARVCVIG